MNYKDKYNELYKLLNTDSLTGVFSRHYIDENFEPVIINSFKKGLSVNLALFDIDCFKDINDTYGHIAGDRILKETAALLKKLLVFSDNDYLARYGGDEFLLLSVDTPQTAFKDKISNCIIALSLHEFHIDNNTITISASAGCTYIENTDFISALNTADKKLYAAKRAGRNRIEF
ncbi:MAG: GGDEF domain-containing protein [Clostridia bacterium]|jgi:diguanylate cyclase (GGDEF)-like protein|nr:GGDEF domain-containing protein [Clostridia bacterium]